MKVKTVVSIKKNVEGTIYIWHSGMLPFRKWYLSKEIGHTGFWGKSKPEIKKNKKQKTINLKAPSWEWSIHFQ